MKRYLLQDNALPGEQVYIDKRIMKKQVPLHWHDFIEIELIVGGKGEQWLNGRLDTLRRGSLSILRQTDFHQMKTDGEMEILHMSMDDSVLTQAQLQQIAEEESLFFQLNEKETHHLEQLILLALDAYQERDTEYLQHIFACVFLCLLKLLPQKSRFASEDEPLRRALLYMHMHFRGNPTLAEVAEVTYYNVSYFSHIFHREMGMTFTQYLASLKVNYAKKLLESTNLKITEVCQECGFPSHSNFLRLIRAETGMTPLEYRNERKTHGIEK